MKKGLFIVFEGGEGSGKSTQCKIAADYLQKKGYDIEMTREPGGTPTGEIIRDVLKDAKLKKTPIAEVLLFNASRDCHLVQKIIPAIEKGKIILCDRFSDSTLAYQVGGRGLSLDLVESINNVAINKCHPDLVIIITRDIEQGLKDAKRVSGKDDHFEKEEIDFHERVNSYYKKLAEDKTFNRVLIDGNKTIGKVSEDIKPILDKIIKENL